MGTYNVTDGKIVLDISAAAIASLSNLQGFLAVNLNLIKLKSQLTKQLL